MKLGSTIGRRLGLSLWPKQTFFRVSQDLAGAARMTFGGALARRYWVVATLNCLRCLPMGTHR